MTRRGWTVLVGAVAVVVFAAAMSILPVPYVALGPGYTVDTLGTVNGKEIVSIDAAVSPSRGHLNMTTVSVIDNIDLLTAIRYWFDDEVAVVPREMVYPSGKNRDQIEKQDAADFVHSQNSAEFAALHQLGYPTQLTVSTVDKGSPASGKVSVGDVITAVNGTQVNSGKELLDQIDKRKPGQDISLSLQREDKQQTIQLTPREKSGSQKGALGFSFTEKQPHPFKISFDLQGIGGPSAGLMFALAIVDKLTPEDLTGGRFIAGTGEINDAGEVAPIGGITQKMLAVRHKGATVFLTPKDNCREALRTAPSGLRLVKVTSLDDAVHSLNNLRTGKGSVPSCRN